MSAPRWNDAIDRMLTRIRDTAGRVREGFPHWADPETGQWATTRDGDWTGGYWIGMLWLAATATGDPRYRAWAEPLAERLRARIDAETVFKSFPAYYGAALGAILHDSPGPRDMALQTAQSFTRLYAPELRLAPLGAQAEEGGHIGSTETSIDSLHAAPFLFWAAGATGDATLREIAANHAETIIHLHLRQDGSFIFAMPFMYLSYKSLDAVENGGPGQQLWKLIEAKGVIPLAWGENGFREITNSKRPVRKPEDLEGLKVRVGGSPVFIDTFRALGANPVNMNWGEAQTAFQTGTVDGQENPVVSVIQPSKLWTVHKNITLWHYAIDPLILGVSKITWAASAPPIVRS